MLWTTCQWRQYGSLLSLHNFTEAKWKKWQSDNMQLGLDWCILSCSCHEVLSLHMPPKHLWSILAHFLDLEVFEKSWASLHKCHLIHVWSSLRHRFWCCLRHIGHDSWTFFHHAGGHPTTVPWCIDTAHKSSALENLSNSKPCKCVLENATTTTFRAHHVHPGKLTCWMIFLCKEAWFLGSMTIRSFSGGYHIFKAANRLIWFLSKLCRAKPWLFRSVGVPSTETASFQPTKLSGFSSPI